MPLHKWYPQPDGVHRVCLPIEHRMSLHDLAAVVAFIRAKRGGRWDPTGATPPQLRAQVREVLHRDGRAAVACIPAAAVTEADRVAAARAFGTPA